jgi:hypothetical protein
LRDIRNRIASGGSASEAPQRVLSKRIRVFSTIIAALTYCAGNAGELFVLTWFACLLESASRLLLEWLIYGWPPRMPQWLMVNQFNPPTWLTPILTAPFSAMAWAFVLSNICARNPDRGAVTAFNIRSGWVRFEVSPAVLIAASIFAITEFLDRLLHYAQLKLFIFLYEILEWPDVAIDIWGYSALVLSTLAMSAVAAWTYPIVAQVLLIGAFERIEVPQLMCGKRLRADDDNLPAVPCALPIR